MTAIVITDEQADLVKNSPAGIVIRSSRGECLGVFKYDAQLEEDIELAIKARDSGGRRYTTAEVLAHLKSMEDREKQP